MAHTPDPKIESMIVGNERLSSTDDYNNYVQSSVSGPFQFGDSKVDVRAHDCGDAGCTCREDDFDGRAYIEELICRQVNCTEDRPAIACNGPVEPFGHCCSVCGGIITFDFDGAFRKKDLEDLVKGEVSSSEVLSSIARITPLEEDFDPSVLKRSKDDQYQLLLTDTDGSGSLAKNEVQNLKKAVSKLPGVSNVVVTISGRPHNASGLSGGAIFGVILALAVAAFAGYKGYHKYDLEYYFLSVFPAKTVSNFNGGNQGGDVEISTVSAGVDNMTFEMNDDDHESTTRYDEAVDFESEEVIAARHAPTGFTNPSFATNELSEESNSGVEDSTILNLENKPIADENVMSSFENLPVPVEEIRSSDVIITSEDVPTSTQDVSVTLQDPENQKENISQAGPISIEVIATEAQDSPTTTDLSFLETATSVVSVPEEETAKDESQNEDSATDQLLDFLS